MDTPGVFNVLRALETARRIIAQVPTCNHNRQWEFTIAKDLERIDHILTVGKQAGIYDGKPLE